VCVCTKRIKHQQTNQKKPFPSPTSLGSAFSRQLILAPGNHHIRAHEK